MSAQPVTLTRRGRTWAILAGAGAVMATALAVVVSAASGGPSVERCETALRAALEAPTVTESRPPACRGISDAHLNQIVERIMIDYAETLLAGAFVEMSAA